MSEDAFTAAPASVPDTTPATSAAPAPAPDATVSPPPTEPAASPSAAPEAGLEGGQAPPSDDTLSADFDRLMAAEARVAEREQAVAAQMEQIREYQELQQLRERDPIAAAQRFGIGPDYLSQAMFPEEQAQEPTPPPEVQAYLEPYQQQIAELRETVNQLTQGQEQFKNEIYTGLGVEDAKTFYGRAGDDDYELTRIYGDEGHRQLYSNYSAKQQRGIPTSFKDEADAIEAAVEGRVEAFLDQLAKTKKYAARIRAKGSATPAPDPAPQPAATPSIQNSDSAEAPTQRSSERLSDREIERRARQAYFEVASRGKPKEAPAT